MDRATGLKKGLGKFSNFSYAPSAKIIIHFLWLKVVTSEKIGGSGVTSTLGTWYGGVVMGVLLSFNEAAILYRDFNSAPSQKQNITLSRLRVALPSLNFGDF